MKKGALIEDIDLRNKYYVFKDRTYAGKLIANMLKNYIEKNTIVLAIPSGGVPVGCEIARSYRLPLDLLIVRKIQIPGNTEAGFGSVGPDFEVIIDDHLVKKLKLTKEQIDRQIEVTKETLKKRNEIMREGKDFPDLTNKNVILVDDGLASGYTMKEAVRFVKRKGVSSIVIAVPTAPLDTINKLIYDVDMIVCPNIREYYPFAVADAYEKWHDLTDYEVIDHLKKVRRENENLSNF